MMEKRNFVTCSRTPGGIGTSDIDDILDAGRESMGAGCMKSASCADSFEKAAMKKDEKSDADSGEA